MKPPRPTLHQGDGGSPPKKGGNGSSLGTGSDDPFDVASPALKSARPVGSRPAKGRMVRVVCPMCETPGFISSKEAGLEVRCCNAKCMMPVFVAPAPEKVEPAKEPEPTGSAAKFWAISGVLLAIALFVAYKFTAGRGGSNDVVIPGPKPAPEVVDDAPPPKPVPGPEVDHGPPRLTKAEVQAQAYTALKSATDYQTSSRGKSVGRALIAESLVDMNRGTEVAKVLDELTGPSEHFRVIPLAKQAWQELAKGERAVAEGLASKAVDAVKSLPEFGRMPMDVRCELAALQCALGHHDQAEQLMPTKVDKEQSQLSLVWRSALGSSDFDLNRLLSRSSLRTHPDPLRGLVTQRLCQQGEWDAAKLWAAAGKNVYLQSSCAAMIAAELADQTTVDAKQNMTNLTEFIKTLPPAGQSLAWTAVAQTQITRQLPEEAAKGADLAAMALAQVQTPSIVEVPDMKSLYDQRHDADFGLPDPAETLLAVAAASSLMECQWELGKKPAALATFQTALDLTIGIAPNLTLAKPLYDQTESTRQLTAKKQLQTLARLPEIELNARFSEYLQACNGWWARAQLRQRLDEEIVIRAATASFRQEAWDEILRREASSDPAIHQTFDSGPALDVLLTLARRANEPALVTPIQARVAKLTERKSYLSESTAAAIRFEFQKRDFARVTTILGGYYNKPDSDTVQVDILAMQTVQQLMVVDKVEGLRVARSLKDSLLREESVRLAAALSACRGDGAELWEEVNLNLLDPADKLAFTRGIIEGSSRVK
ncbi:MAG: hypothetical protein R3C01_09695 [Planctomycetaceae bacterium]